MTEWFLEHQAQTGLVFRDGQAGLPLGIGDLVLECLVEGRVYTLDQAILTSPALAQLQCSCDGSIVLSTTSAQVSIWGQWTVITARDLTRRSMLRLVVLTAALPNWTGMAGALDLVQRCCRALPTTLSSINGLSGEVRLTINRFLQPTYPAAGSVLLTGADPAVRAAVDCPSNPCAAKVFTINGQVPSVNGQALIQSDDCFKIVPGSSAHQLAWRNDCKPCCNCDELFAVNNHLLTQESYLHNLSAIHQDQFNRYQARASVAERKTCLGDITTCGGNVFMVVRSIDRPYFNQAVIGFVNETGCGLSIQISCRLLNSGGTSTHQVADQFDRVGGFTQGGFNTAEGEQQIVVPWAGFTLSGGEVVTFTVEPRRSFTVSSEIHRVRLDSTAPTTATWSADVIITATPPIDPLDPSTTPTSSVSTLTRTFTMQVLKAAPATVVA